MQPVEAPREADRAAATSISAAALENRADTDKTSGATGDKAVDERQSGKTADTAAAESLAADLDRLEADSDVPGQDDANSTDDEGADEVYESLLTKMRRALNLSGADDAKPKTPILDSFDLAGIASLIKQGKAKKIIFMCGAGISVSAGIPDFRSPKTGLYNNLQKYNLPHPQAVFELDYFRKKPQAFYQLAKEIFPGNFRPTPAHFFMTMLHQKGLLLRCFTQNIDSLERQAGLPPEKIVAAHGNFDTAHCIKCKREVSLDAVKQAVDAEKPCRCPRCGGLVKPDIVFFGESLPQAFFARASTDFPAADLLIVMGTSLVVNPFASLIDRVDRHVPRLLVNRERVGEYNAASLLLGSDSGFRFDDNYRDALFLGDCDAGVRELAQSLGWQAELDALLDSHEEGAAPPSVTQSGL